MATIRHQTEKAKKKQIKANVSNVVALSIALSTSNVPIFIEANKKLLTLKWKPI